MDNDCSTFLLM